MKHEPIFNWDPETGLASCILSDGSHIFTETYKEHLNTQK